MTPEEIAAYIEPPTKKQQDLIAGLPAPTPEPVINLNDPVFNELAIKVKKHNSEFRIMENVLTLGQLSMTRKPELRAGKAVLFVRSDSLYADSPLLFMTGAVNSYNSVQGTGNCSLIANAGINRVLDILEVKAQFSHVWFVGILHEPSLAKEPKSRKYAIESVLGQTIIELARLAPMNPTLRSHLTAIYHTPPPPEADTFQKLKDWMEFEFDPPFLDGVRKTHYGINPPSMRPGSPPVDREQAAAFSVKVIIKGKQIGTCRYIADVTIEKSPAVRVSQLTRWVRDGITLSDIVQNAHDQLVANTDLNFDAAEVVNHVYSEHIFEDVEAVERVIDIEAVKIQVIDYLRRTYGAEEAQQIIDRR